jgi:hypothetical protein
LCILADPAVVDQPDGHRTEEIDFLPAAVAGEHQAGFRRLLEFMTPQRVISMRDSGT